MSYGLFGTEYPFFTLFTRRYAILRESVLCLDSIFKHRDTVADQCRRIQTLGAEAEQLHREVAKALSVTFIQPFDRDDIHELNQAFEAAIDAIRAVSTRLGLYGFTEIKSAAGELADDLREMVEELAPMMEKLIRKGGIDEHRERTRKIKAEADMLVMVALGELYEQEPANPHDIMDVVKWSQVYDRLETAFDAMERVMNQIESIVLKKV